LLIGNFEPKIGIMEARAKKSTPPNWTETPKNNKPFKPIRDYHHSHSFLKIKDNEWEGYVDSDNEDNGEWVREVATSVSILALPVIWFQPDVLDSTICC
jgi:hypothetical protein